MSCCGQTECCKINKWVLVIVVLLAAVAIGYAWGKYAALKQLKVEKVVALSVARSLS